MGAVAVAVLVGLVNLVFTVVAMALIDKLGRRPLLLFGLSIIAACMFLLAYVPPLWFRVMDPKALALVDGDMRKLNRG